MSCPAKAKDEVPSRGSPSIEFYKDGKPQYFCIGWNDPKTDELIETCANCRQNVIYAEKVMKGRD